MSVPHVRLKWLGGDCAPKWAYNGVYHLGYEGVWVIDGIAEIPVSDTLAIETLLRRGFGYADDLIQMHDGEPSESEPEAADEVVEDVVEEQKAKPDSPKRRGK